MLQRKSTSITNRYRLKHNLLYRINAANPENLRLIVDPDLLEEIFREFHGSPLGGHFGVEKTYLQIAQRFWCKYMFDKIKQLCDNCEVCAKSKPTNVIFVDPNAKPIPKKIFERMELDVQ